MADHTELVAEMVVLEQMGTQERQKLAKKRRLQQLKKWSQREKEWAAKEKQINKRLANTLHEENNGLDLKQYTTYSSSYRSKKRLQSTTSKAIELNSVNINGNNNNQPDYLNNNHHHNALESSLENRRPLAGDASLMPNGRVHFNVGVMLLEAAARNDYHEVKRLLELGVSPDSVNHDGLTALHQCCIDASEDIMRLLLEFGANVDARDTEQWTPIHAACTCGHLNLVKILVEYGANLLAVNGDGNMPFDICEDEATLDYIEREMVNQGITQDMIDLTRASTEMQMIADLESWLAQGKDLNWANENGVTALHIAAANGYLSVVKFLLKHCVNVNACDTDLWRPLHGAACWGNDQHVKIVELLVESGAQLEAKTINEETVFDLCDNVVLLERLNQLKDELESKQQSATDRLKRTQSRTSRVLSVRRTSVRDKNQISRREAREEALLRVDSSTEVLNIKPGDTTVLANGLKSDNVHESAEDQNNLVAQTQSHMTTTTSPPSVAPITTTNMILDVIDGFELNHATEESNHHETLSTSKSSSDVKKSLSRENISNKLNSKDSNTYLVHQASWNQQLVNDNKPTTTRQAPELGNTAYEQQRSENTPTIMRAAKTSVLLKSDAIASSNDQYSTNMCKINNSTADSDLHDSLIIPQNGSAPQVVPINYTLSNLKKQRSDLRMRTTSIGGSSCLVNDHQQVLLDPQPSSLPNNALHRPGSPSNSFRKFIGEPAESMGLTDRTGRRHRCCTII